MTELLEIKGCRIISGNIIPLPVLKGHSKHRLPDGNPRHLLYRVLRYRHQNYALLEVDTSDFETRLSTFLLKKPVQQYDWHSKLSDLGKLLVKNSLRLHKKKLEKEFPGGYQRISHQQTTSGSTDLLDPTTLSRWAGRVYAFLVRL
jgi:hypothetical protein